MAKICSRPDHQSEPTPTPTHLNLMKSKLISGLLGASIVLFGSPAFAQDAPAPKKQQRIVVKKQSKANSELLQKAAELSAKASALAAEGDAAGAAKYAAEASAVLKKAQQAERKVQRDVARTDRESAQRDRVSAQDDRKRDVRVRVEREQSKREPHDRADSQEPEVRVRVERGDFAINEWVQELANVQSGEAHEHALRSYEEAMKLHEHANTLHEQNTDLHERYLKLNAERGTLGHLLHDEGEVAGHLLNLAPAIELLENGEMQIQLRARLENLAELEHLNVDLTDLHDTWALRVGELAGIDTMVELAPGMERVEFDLLGSGMEGVDLAALGIDLAAINVGDVQAFALAMPNGDQQNGVWAMAPHEGKDALLKRYIVRTNEQCECEGEECEDGCASKDAQRRVMDLFTTLAPHESLSTGGSFLPGEYSNLKRNVQVFVAPDGHEGMNWTSEGNARMDLTIDRGEHQIFEWTTDANPFLHKENVEIHGEHDVRVLRSGQGGEIIIHGGDGEQNIYIQGHMVMPGQRSTEDHDVHMHDGTTDLHMGHFVPQPPRAPRAPHAPEAPRAMLRLPSPLASPRVILRGADGEAIHGQVIIKGEMIDFSTEGAADGLADVLFAPRDASAPAPVRVKNKKMEAEQLIQEMRAEMQALRQELSDLRRQMKNDPLVRAQHDTRSEDARVWRASMTPVADRKRAGLGSR
jgi:hypothetical protein